ncbi:WXG100 family type VII secretion target [Mycolicibacterium obuense]|uniref:ESAT-6-like protein n=1 Tax=Mycolicibacterium obuense TaxID=1807 RepID=A0A0J6Y8M2_9MYCO|nr:WXG100 family type VII secretion target [Mycolicibacterium obuense]KMO69356.1 6 kDa early secretory antigenic target [Mycolicibacterium obuense]
MSGPITYNFAGIETDAADISGAVGRVNGLLSEGQSALNSLQAAWVGTGSDSYQNVQMRWNQNSEELNLALQNLGHAVANAGHDMGATEKGVEGTFSV